MSEDMAQQDAIFATSDDLQEITEIDLPKVRPDPNQPRQFFDEEDLEELASSIRQHGQLQPIMVRPDPTQRSAPISSLAASAVTGHSSA